MTDAVARHFSAELRVYGHSIDDISRRLAATPTSTQRAGELRPIAALGRWDENMWGYDSDAQIDASLEEHISCLLDRFADKDAQLRELGTDGGVVFWCACFTVGPEVTLDVSNETLARIVGLGARLSISTYFCDEEE